MVPHLNGLLFNAYFNFGVFKLLLIYYAHVSTVNWFSHLCGIQFSANAVLMTRTFYVVVTVVG